MVVGITVADKTYVFLATSEVVKKFADQIATVLEVPISGPRGPQPAFPLAEWSGQETGGRS